MIKTFWSELHPEKDQPISLTELGMVSEVSDLQDVNVLLVDYQYYTL